MSYCPECSCGGCVARKLYIQRYQERLAGLQERQLESKLAHLNLAEWREEQADRERLAIWLLVNTAETPDHADMIMNDIAKATGDSYATINRKRKMFVEKLEKRVAQFVHVHLPFKFTMRLVTAGAIGRNTNDRDYWAKIPGTRGTELPPADWPVRKPVKGRCG